MDGETRIQRVLAQNLRRYMEKDPAIDTLPKLAAKSGAGYGTVQRALNCGGAATIDTLEKLASAIGCQPWELLVDDEATREAAIRRFMK